MGENKFFLCAMNLWVRRAGKDQRILAQLFAALRLENPRKSRQKHFHVAYLKRRFLKLSHHKMGLNNCQREQTKKKEKLIKMVNLTKYL